MLGRMSVRILLFLLAATFALPAAALDQAAVEHTFEAWIDATVWPEAKAAKVSRATFDRAFAGVTLDWQMPDLQPPGIPVSPPAAEWQSEFGSPGDYFDEGRLSALAAAGRGRLAQWQKTLAAIAKTYGVPPGIIVAIWAKESGYGAASLPKPAIRALATEAFMGRRADFFRGELVAALVILEHGDVTLADMRSSLAGALGQPQFMPSFFLRYAVDFDGDGRRDIWNSVPDTLASIAHFLQGQGWVRGRGWGVEAKVPSSVACSLDGPDQGKPLAEWTHLGIVRADGTPIPGDPADTFFLLMPEGRFGPAFLVTPNFYVLKQYNNSDLYALYVGTLADRFADDRPFRNGWRDVGSLTRGSVKAMQDALVAAGYDVGGNDGFVGYKTRIAIGLWQAKHGMAPTCWPDAALVRVLH